MTPALWPGSFTFYQRRGNELDFQQLLQMLMNPGEDGVPDSIYDDLSASYTDATSTRDAKISETDGLVSELQAELNRVKAMNYDLMIAQVAEPEAPGDNENNSDDSDQDDVGDDDDFFADDEDGK